MIEMRDEIMIMCESENSNEELLIHIRYRR